MRNFEAAGVLFGLLIAGYAIAVDDGNERSCSDPGYITAPTHRNEPQRDIVVVEDLDVQ